MFKEITEELKHHAPFTFCGALSGIVLMILFWRIPREASYRLFYIFHPAHVVLSALVTASMYKLHRRKGSRNIKSLFALLAVGYAGAIGVATLSDSLIPYLGETLLKLPERHIHIGFIERWWLINPLALIGIAIAYFIPNTRFPHAGHVLISTWASLFHIMLAKNGALPFLTHIMIFLFLFLAVWLPCCISDIVFPLLFVKRETKQ